MILLVPSVGFGVWSLDQDCIDHAPEETEQVL
jgi:hypothetical protein